MFVSVFHRTERCLLGMVNDKKTNKQMHATGFITEGAKGKCLETVIDKAYLCGLGGEHLGSHLVLSSLSSLSLTFSC